MKNISVFTMVLLGNTAFVQDGAAPVALTSGSSDQDIAHHLYHHEMNQTQTGELAVHFPDLSRERAYAIQRGRLHEYSESDEHVGWKLGWTRRFEGDGGLDPIMGLYMSKRVYAEGKPVSTR